jgi:hypothetical protein
MGSRNYFLHKHDINSWHAATLLTTATFVNVINNDSKNNNNNIKDNNNDNDNNTYWLTKEKHALNYLEIAEAAVPVQFNFKAWNRFAKF